MHRRTCSALLMFALAGLPAGWAAAQVGAGVAAPGLNPPTGAGRLPLQDRTQPGVGGPSNAAPVPTDPAIVRPTRRINRNPAFREDLPPAPAPRESERVTIPPQTTDSSRVTLVPHPAPCDPRNSTTRPVRIPESDNPAASPCAP